MELTVAGDVVVDFATKDDLDRHHQRIEKLIEKTARQRIHRLRGGASSKATPIVIDFGKPPMGMFWLPQWALVWGNDAFTNVANVAWVLFAGPLPSASLLAVGPPVLGLDQADPILTGGNSGISVPSSQNIPDKTIVWSRDNLFVVLSGSGLVAGATAYHACVGVEERPDTEEARVW
jgi:hypothetical protein